MGKDDFIKTASGKTFWPAEPKIEHIDIQDIAHALSLLCRGNGQLKHFYSVGQHSVYCCQEAINRGYSKDIQLACLLHDASEAYISDITRPVKRLLGEYLVLEERLQNTIYECYNLTHLTEDDMEKVKEIDDAILSYELKHLLNVDHYNQLTLTHNYDLSFIPMNDIKNSFIEYFNQLT